MYFLSELLVSNYKALGSKDLFWSILIQVQLTQFAWWLNVTHSYIWWLLPPLFLTAAVLFFWQSATVNRLLELVVSGGEAFAQLVGTWVRELGESLQCNQKEAKA